MRLQLLLELVVFVGVLEPSFQQQAVLEESPTPQQPPAGSHRYGPEYRALCGVYNLYELANESEGRKLPEKSKLLKDVSDITVFDQKTLKKVSKIEENITNAASYAERKGNESVLEDLLRPHNVSTRLAYKKLKIIKEKAKNVAEKYGEKYTIYSSNFDAMLNNLKGMADDENVAQWGKQDAADYTPEKMCKTAVGTEGEKPISDRAGNNVLVDMACLCIPVHGPCDACLTNDTLKGWWENDGTDMKDKRKGKKLKGVTQEIEQMKTGCANFKTTNEITPDSIGQAINDFYGVLGRWRNEAGLTANEENQVGDDETAKGKKGSGGCRHAQYLLAETPVNTAFLGKPSATGKDCDGARDNHCVKYSGEPVVEEGLKAGSKEMKYNASYNQWMQKLKAAYNHSEKVFEALPKLQELKTQLHHLKLMAEQVRDEVHIGFEGLYAGNSRQNATEFDFGKHMRDHCEKQATADDCRKVVICSWNAEANEMGGACEVAAQISISTASIVATPDPAKVKEFEDKKKECEDLKEQTPCEEKKDQCKWEAETCQIALEPPIRAPAQPGRSHINPTFLYPLFFF